MKTSKLLIRSVYILTLLLMAHFGNCFSVINTDTLTQEQKEFYLSISPDINRDLKICDLVKAQNGILIRKVDDLESTVKFERAEKLTAQKQTRKEKRKRKIFGVLRTIGEVVVLIAIITL